MWQIIQSNKRKSVLLFILIGIVLLALGALVGASFFGEGGFIIGLSFALILWTILSSVSYFSGSKLLLKISNATEVSKNVHPQLFNVVEEMTIAAGLPKMPKVYIINDQAPNAFATGRDPSNCAVAITAGLLTQLNRDELQGVIAHEIAHIKNRDILFMTFAGVMLGSIVLISQIFLRGMWFTGGGGRYKSRDSGGGQAQMIIMIVAIVFAILSPILTQMLYFAISRRREYLADASGARFTRYPEGLASALEKLSQNKYTLKSANKVTAGLFIVNPLNKKGMKLSDLTSTHPPISERIKILRNMNNGAGYNDYQLAFNKVKNKSSAIIPSSEIKKAERISKREGSADDKTMSKKKTQRELGDLMMNVNGYVFLACVCGLKLKFPPGFKEPQVKCPKCGREHKVPLAELAAVTGAINEGVKK
ncbi:MAG: M48 family metallopeptidase [Ignavibacteriae bacterium]|nr:peptidase M28 [Ignavibacteriota bacterium]NOH00367.1 M48 family metallopeptidase [Ignavibacteriota bacterium]